MRNEKLPALAEALSGMRFGPEHAHAAASLLRAIDLLDAELRDLHERITAHLAAIPGSWGVDGDGVTGPGAGQAADAAALPAAERLDEIPPHAWRAQGPAQGLIAGGHVRRAWHVGGALRETLTALRDDGYTGFACPIGDVTTTILSTLPSFATNSRDNEG